jgi:hypothetical protein
LAPLIDDLHQHADTWISLFKLRRQFLLLALNKMQRQSP